MNIFTCFFFSLSFPLRVATSILTIIRSSGNKLILLAIHWTLRHPKIIFLVRFPTHFLRFGPKLLYLGFLVVKKFLRLTRNNPQHEGSGCHSSSGHSSATCPALLVLPGTVSCSRQHSLKDHCVTQAHTTTTRWTHHRGGGGERIYFKNNNIE